MFISVMLLMALGFVWYSRKYEEKSINGFEECVEAGNPVMESYPEQCRSKDGRVFSRNIGNELEKSDKIRVESPRPGDGVSSPLQVSGQARGMWFFEAEFLAKVADEGGVVLGQGIMRAEGEWMTEDFVDFSGEVVFDRSERKAGQLILEKSNPSGLPENDEQLVIPIKF